MPRARLSVAVIDAHRPGWGASGRNGGQAITGFAKDGVIERQLGAAGARAAWSLSLDGVELIAERIARYAIDCDFTRGYLTVATKPRRVGDLRAWMDAARTRWGHPSLSWLDTAGIRARIASPRYLAGVHDPLSGHLHPLKYCLGLADAARREASRCMRTRRRSTSRAARGRSCARRRARCAAASSCRAATRGRAASCRPRRPRASRRSRRTSSRPSRSGARAPTR
jgi:glycine/D-amino acid oxidase-like deaminating enzyme